MHRLLRFLKREGDVPRFPSGVRAYPNWHSAPIRGYVFGMRYLPAFLLLPALLAACGDKAAILLTADIRQPTVSVADGAAGSTLSGSFQLVLALGAEASGPTHVTLGNFSLQTEAGVSLVDVLKLDSSPEFPIDLDKGATQTVSFTFDEDSVDRDALCAGRVRIVGSVLDSLKGGTDPVSSELTTPDCGAT